MADHEGMTEPKFAGMSVNERLFVAGLLETFDDSVRKRDRSAMIALLRKVGLADQAEGVADRILADPRRYNPQSGGPTSYFHPSLTFRRFTCSPGRRKVWLWAR